MAECIEYIRGGPLRALAVMSRSRSSALPDIPVIGDFLPGLEAGFWTGLAAPKNTPAEIITRLNTSVNAGLADPKLKARFADLGAIVFPGSPVEFRKFIGDETEKWGKVIRAANIKLE
jgi:tripartite-type tricarboxylate transporter receptor subunit TctC